MYDEAKRAPYGEHVEIIFDVPGKAGARPALNLGKSRRVPFDGNNIPTKIALFSQP